MEIKLEEFLKEVTYKGLPADDADFLWETIDGCEYNGLPVLFIAQEGGGEGGSEHCYTVLKIGNVYYRFEYRYFSHDGFDFSGATLREVKPTKRTIVVYE